MNWDIIAGTWKQLRGHAKQSWGWLTDDPHDTIDGRRDQLAGVIQKTYGITRYHAQRCNKAFERVQKEMEPKVKA